MNAKQNDKIVKEKKVDITPIDYTSLNKLSEHFVAYFVPKKQLSAEQAFWLPILKTFSEQPSVQPKPVQNDLPHQLPTTSMVKQNLLKAKSHLDNFDKVIKVKTKVTRQKEGTWEFEHIRGAFKIYVNDRILEQIIFQDVMCTTMHSYDDLVEYVDMEQSYIDEYSKCLELAAELSKKKDMVEKVEFFEINELKAKLQTKNITISNLKDHIATLKGKSMFDCTAPVNNSNVIALGMFKLDFPSLSPRLKKNKEAHLDYLNKTKHADTLCALVEQARALKPLDNVLDYACKFATRIQELLLYVSATCPGSRNNSEKLVGITPMNKNRQVRFAEPSTSTSNTQKQINGTEFVNQTLKSYYEDVCISHQKSVTLTPQQNDVVKKRNRTLVEVARTMLIFLKALLFLWSSNLKYLHVFGALCYPTNDSEDLRKLKPKADIGIFIGYSPAKKAYKIYNKQTRLIMETIHAKFDELTTMASEQFSLGPEFNL
ncbi:retrovirus-related pol polyprotein from transposon TNT 1-94 [Tanacetum coccineum]|uniref:Retrovirus-related pol polyprotein from transposon TNT 1-94 n=1 Tax=Tanacetum coccineum TaxID=301880 RepID=A0ABQ4YSY5_9ASTR